MPELTRKRINDRPETWHVHYAGVRVGLIVERSGPRRYRINGNGAAGFTRAAIRATIDTAPRLTSERRAMRLRRLGEIICQSAAMSTSRNGVGMRRGML